MSTQLWKLRLEVSIPDENTQRNNVGFMNVLTWAETVDSAKQKIGAYFLSFSWQIVNCCEASLVEDNFVADDDDFQGMIERARNNPQAIIYGTFHTYKLN